MPLTYGCVKNDNGWRSGMVCAGSIGGTWYECQCCPYGYHIDLDFVRYCDSLNNISSTGYEQGTCAGGSIRRRQDRRRQRQSMEVLLGLVPDDMLTNVPPPVSADNINKRRPIQMPTVSELSAQSSTSVDDIRNSLNDVVQEFELTLQRTKGKRDQEQRNLPDVTAVTVPENNNHIDENHIANNSLLLETECVADGTTGTHATPQQQQQIIPSQPDERDFDAISIESATNLSPGALQNIRTQMALSLERTRHLEDMVNSIPTLRDELDELKRENTRLVIQCSYWEKAAHRSPEPEPSPRPPLRPPPPQLDAYMAHRDAAVLATVLTRTVAVGSQVPLQRTTSTQTPLPPPPSPPEPSTSSDQRATQTPSQQHSSKYTQASPPLPPATFARSTQSAPPAPKITVAVSEDTITEKECVRCIELKQQIQDQQVLPEVLTPSIVPMMHASPVRTVSIAIGTEVPSKPTPRTQASQATTITIDKSQQATEQKTVTAHKMSQCEYVSSVSKHTQHKPAAQSKAIQTQGQAPINTLPELTVILPLQPAPSRIPVPRTPPAPPSPTATRTFRRQDTYTKLPMDDKLGMGLSGLDLGCETSTAYKTPRSLSSITIIEQEHTSQSSIPLQEQSFIEELIVPTSNAAATNTELQLENSAETTIAKYDVASSSSTPSYMPPTSAIFEKFEQKFILPKVITGSSKHAASAATQQSPTKTPPEPVSSDVAVLSTTPQPHPSGSPSREMQAAVKVLNDSLERGNSVAPGAAVAPHLRTAHQLIEREWFRVSSLVGADPLHVEAYLDHLDAVGSRVLQYIVNMVDSSGNTAMHYSVSHGNFDVVSILLDSKVCDVNRQNLAGYTSLMLVSLAEVRSSTHAGVVRRLFALGDVNVRARGHGQTALMLAVSHGRGDMVAMLLTAGADINIQDDDGSTALMCAAEHGHVDIVRQFLAQPDCDSRVTDVDGCTALRIAMDAGHRHIGVLLYAHERRLVHGPASAPATPPRRRSNSATSTSTVDQVREENVLPL